MSKNIKDRACIIGASSIIDPRFLKNLDKDFLLVACDGGYYHFLKEKLEPDILVGDFDTLDENEIKNPGVISKLNPIKDDTDTFWAIKYLISKGYQEIRFYGCLGQKLDHTLANIQLLAYLKDNKVKAYLYTPDNSSVLFLLRNESISFKKEAKGKLSVFSYGKEANGVYETNLKYTLNNATLTDSVPLGISNEFIRQTATLTVKEGTLLVMAPTNSF